MKRKKILTKRVRKKLLSSIPANYNFWCRIIATPKDLQQFLERGNERQKSCIIRILNYIRKFNQEKFEQVKGKYWLKTFKGSLHEN